MFVSKKTANPRSLMDHAEYSEAWKRLQEIKTKKQNAERRRGEIEAQLSELGTFGRGAALDADAKRMLGGTAVAEETTVDAGALRFELDDIAKKLPVMARAIELQEARLPAIRAAASKEICEAARPAYAAAVAKMVKLAAELNAAAAEEHRIRRELIDGDVAFASYLRPMVLRGFVPAGAGDKNAAENFLAEAREYFPEIRV